MPNDRMERFTERSRRVLRLAQEEADNMHHGEIGTEHILLALIREEGGIAGRVLRDVGIQYVVVRSIVKDTNTPSISSRLDLASDTKKLLEFTVDEARRRGDSFIGTEHLLMGLTRQSYSKACTTLKHLNIDISDVYQRADNLRFDDKTTTFPAFASIALSAVLSKAQEEAAQLHSQAVQPEHLFLAMLHNEDGSASKLIRELDLTQGQIREMVHVIKRQPSKTKTDSLKPDLSQDSHEIVNSVYMPYGNFSDQLLTALLHDWWILKDLWQQKLLKPQQVQAALERTQTGLVVYYRKDLNLREYLQLYVDFFFPPPLRRALMSFIQNLRNKRTGT
jgi:ATP-dependent Clp protease ATP-binding subunit ClpA